MKKSRELLLLVFLLVGCTTTGRMVLTVESSNNDTDLPIHYVDSELVPYLTSFKAEARKQGFLVSSIPITMIFGHTATKDHPNAVGWCSTSSGRLFIRISRKYFFDNDNPHREELVYHEIGHCLISRNHCDYINPKTRRRVSIMSSDMGTDDDYKENRDEYLKELFHIDEHCT